MIKIYEKSVLVAIKMAAKKTMLKNVEKSGKMSKVDPKMGSFGYHFETRFKAIRNLGSQAPPWTVLAQFWGHFGVILGSCWGAFCVILDAVLQIVFVFCRVSAALCCALLCCALLYSTLLCCAVLYSAPHSSSLLCALCFALLCSALLCSALL